MRSKFAELPKNDTAYLIEVNQNPLNHGQTGGSRINPDPGVPHFPDSFYLENYRELNLGPDISKIILIRQVNKNIKGPKDFEKFLGNKLGEGFKIDFALKEISSKKYPDIKVLATFITLKDNLIPELEKYAKEANVPLLNLKKSKQDKKSYLIKKIGFNLKLISEILKK